MPDAAWDLGRVLPVERPTAAPRHSATVRATHWVTVLCFVALLVSGLEIVVSHPRFYWGENGNALMPALFSIPIPASRSTVPTGYGYVLPDQNGWSRYLHFEAAWLLVATGLLYAIVGMFNGHFRRNLMPGPGLPAEDETWSYNPIQRTTYLAVIFVLFPLMIWTGLAMSPAFVSAVPSTVTLLGGRQTARTLHFFVSIGLVLFLAVHVVMVWRAGFTRRVAAMITGHVRAQDAHE